MPTPAENNCAAKAALPAYSTSWDHLSDELRRLDIRLHKRVLAQSERPVDPLAPFKGLVISQAEVLELLEPKQLGSRTDGAEQQDLDSALVRLDVQMEERRTASVRSGVHLSLARLGQLFHLTRFEEECLVICLAPELDRKYETLYAYLQDDTTRRRPTVDLILNLLCPTQPEKLAARVVFDPQATLLKYRLWQMTETGPEGSVPLLSRSLKLDDRIVNFLLGFTQIDARLEPIARLISPNAEWSETLEGLYERTHRFVHSHFSDPQSANRNLVFYFCGAYGSGRRSIVEALSRDLGLQVLIGDLEKMVSGQGTFDELAWLVGREAVLQPAVLCLENGDCLLADRDKHASQLESLLRSVVTFSRVTFLLGSRPWRPRGELADKHVFIAVEFATPDAGAGRRLWESQLNKHEGLADDVDCGALASKFRFGPSRIRDVLGAAGSFASWRSPYDGLITMADLYAACRALSNSRLGALARKIEPRYGWHDIVLPADQLLQMREICHQATYRHTVYGDWGFERKLALGKGLNALFSGPPGTGKTMAAQVIANELQLDLYQIDLSQVVSKYIGETEKNLHNIFSEAQTSHAILFFDEADALFGKRSEVKDAHDRYANIEVGYLLQKMEEYEGIAILATNLRKHLDDAFVRRMHFIVEFPFPDEEYRRRIWEVTFPREAPLAAEVDFGALAREIKLAGGNIKNIGLSAAFYAAADGGVIQRSHLTRAARREFEKLGRNWDQGE